MMNGALILPGIASVATSVEAVPILGDGLFSVLMTSAY